MPLVSCLLPPAPPPPSPPKMPPPSKISYLKQSQSASTELVGMRRGGKWEVDDAGGLWGVGVPRLVQTASRRGGGEPPPHVPPRMTGRNPNPGTWPLFPGDAAGAAGAQLPHDGAQADVHGGAGKRRGGGAHPAARPAAVRAAGPQHGRVARVRGGQGAASARFAAAREAVRGRQPRAPPRGVRERR